MDSAPQPADADRLALRSAGVLADVYADLAAIRARLEAAPDWRPAGRLLAEADWARGQLDQMTLAWSNKLVVAIVGPSGAGKSTLLNALAGCSISPTGLQRPTTRDIVAYVADEQDVAALRTRWNGAKVRAQVEPAAPQLQYLILVDAPDTNTTPEGMDALGHVLETADVVVAVFAAQNPRLHDNIQFLAPYIRRLPAGAVVPVVNMVDRAPLEELRQQVLPDLQQAIASNWGFSPERIYLVSARASLPDAVFAADEQPLHGVNEFGALRQWLFSALNRASQVVDRRLARAHRLVALVREDVMAAVSDHDEALALASRQLDRLDGAVTAAMRDALHDSGEFRGLDLHAAVYGRLASRWWGPLGWVVAVWGALVRVVAWVSRLGRPRQPTLSGAEPEPPIDVSDLNEALDRLYVESWPPVADALDSAGFGGLRYRDRWRLEAQNAGGRLQAGATVAVGQALDVSARRLAHPLLQMALNGPVLLLLGWVGYQTVAAFATGHYLPASYFQNAGIALMAVWAGSFILLQVIVSLAVRTGVRRRAARALADAATWRLASELRAQIGALLGR